MNELITTAFDETTGEFKPRTPVFLRTPYNYDMNAASDESGLYCPEETRTQQQFAEEVDINTIVRKFGLTGEMPENLNERMPNNGDFSNTVNDFHTAQNMVRKAQEAFMELPAEVRAEFNNDPGRFINFVDDPKNRDRAKELGMLKPDAPAPDIPTVRILKEEPDAPPK